MDWWYSWKIISNDVNKVTPWNFDLESHPFLPSALPLTQSSIKNTAKSQTTARYKARVALLNLYSLKRGQQKGKKKFRKGPESEYIKLWRSYGFLVQLLSCYCSMKTSRYGQYKWCDCVQIKLCLGTMKSEFHISFKGHEILLFSRFFQLFKVWRPSKHAGCTKTGYGLDLNRPWFAKPCLRAMRQLNGFCFRDTPWRAAWYCNKVKESRNSRKYQED